MPLPDFVVVEFSARCNLKCGFCFGPVDDRTVRDLPTEFWLQVIDWVAELGALGISVSGGEPTIHKDITVLLKHAKMRGLATVLSTHGQIYKRVLQCAEFTDWIAFPIDGATTEMLLEMRGKPWGVADLRKTVSAVRAINPNVRIKVGTVATRVNLREVVTIGQQLLANTPDINTWKIYQYTARRQFAHRAATYRIEDDEYRDLQQEVLSALGNPPFEIVFSGNRERERAYVFVYPNGTVAVPNVGPGMTDLVLGNAFREGRAVLERVTGVHDSNHVNNYRLTYPLN